MREDVFVGTLRVVSSDDEAFSIKSRSLGYVSLHNALIEAERSKPNYPKSGTALKVGGSTAQQERTVWVQPSNGSLAPNPNSTPERLRLAAIPGVSLVRVSEADLATRGLLKAIAGAFRRDANLTINLKGVETLEIDDISAAKALKFGVENPLFTDPWFGNGICTSAVALKDPSLEKIQIQMVTRVFYARAIEYNYGENTSAALKQVSGSEGIIETENVFQPSSTDAGAAVEDGEIQKSENPAVAQTADIANAAPGTVAKIAVQRKDGSSLTEVFDRPLAVGVGVIAVSPKALGLECDSAGRRIKPIFNEISNPSLVQAKVASKSGTKVGGTSTATATETNTATATTTAVTTTLTGPDAATCQQLVANADSAEERQRILSEARELGGLKC